MTYQWTSCDLLMRYVPRTYPWPSPWPTHDLPVTFPWPTHDLPITDSWPTHDLPHDIVQARVRGADSAEPDRGGVCHYERERYAETTQPLWCPYDRCCVPMTVVVSLWPLLCPYDRCGVPMTVVVSLSPLWCPYDSCCVPITVVVSLWPLLCPYHRCGVPMAAVRCGAPMTVVVSHDRCGVPMTVEMSLWPLWCPYSRSPGYMETKWNCTPPPFSLPSPHLNRFCHDGGDDHNGDVDGDDYCDCDEDGSAPSIKIN